jgi:hypothetical protein
MESNHRYYARRAVEELRAAARAVTPEAQARRRALADQFARKAEECRRGDPRTMPAGQMAAAAGFEAAAC